MMPYLHTGTWHFTLWYMTQRNNACFLLLFGTHCKLQAVNPLPNSLVLQQLVALEREANSLIQSRQEEASLSLAPMQTVSKKLRLYVYATHTNQPVSSSASGHGTAQAACMAGSASGDLALELPLGKLG